MSSFDVSGDEEAPAPRASSASSGLGGGAFAASSAAAAAQQSGSSPSRLPPPGFMLRRGGGGGRSASAPGDALDDVTRGAAVGSGAGVRALPGGGSSRLNGAPPGTVATRMVPAARSSVSGTVSSASGVGQYEDPDELREKYNHARDLVTRLRREANERKQRKQSSAMEASRFLSSELDMLEALRAQKEAELAMQKEEARRARHEAAQKRHAEVQARLSAVRAGVGVTGAVAGAAARAPAAASLASSAGAAHRSALPPGAGRLSAGSSSVLDAASASGSARDLGSGTSYGDEVVHMPRGGHIARQVRAQMASDSYMAGVGGTGTSTVLGSAPAYGALPSLPPPASHFMTPSRAPGASDSGELDMGVAGVMPELIDRTTVIPRPLQVRSWQQPAALREARQKQKQLQEVQQRLQTMARVTEQMLREEQMLRAELESAKHASPGSDAVTAATAAVAAVAASVPRYSPAGATSTAAPRSAKQSPAQAAAAHPRQGGVGVSPAGATSPLTSSFPINPPARHARLGHASAAGAVVSAVASPSPSHTSPRAPVSGRRAAARSRSPRVPADQPSSPDSHAVPSASPAALSPQEGAQSSEDRMLVGSGSRGALQESYFAVNVHTPASRRAQEGDESRVNVGMSPELKNVSRSLPFEPLEDDVAGSAAVAAMAPTGAPAVDDDEVALSAGGHAVGVRGAPASPSSDNPAATSPTTKEAAMHVPNAAPPEHAPLQVAGTYASPNDADKAAAATRIQALTRGRQGRHRASQLYNAQTKVESTYAREGEESVLLRDNPVETAGVVPSPLHVAAEAEAVVAEAPTAASAISSDAPPALSPHQQAFVDAQPCASVSVLAHSPITVPTESDNKAPTPLPSDHGAAVGGGDVAHDGEPSPSLSTQGPAADVSAFASTSPRAHSAVIHEPAAATELEHAPDNTPLVTEAPQPLLQNQPEELAATAHSEHVEVEPREICEPAVDAQRHAGDEVDDKTVTSLTRMQAIARGRQTRRRVSQSHAAEIHSAPNAHSQASGVHSLDTSGDAGTAVNEGEDAVAALVAAAEEQADTHDHATDRSHTPPPGSLLQSTSPGEHSTAPGVAQPGTIPTSPSPPRAPVLSEPAEPEDALLAPLPSSAASPGGHFAEDSLEGKDGEEAAHSSAAHDVNMLDDSLMQ